jgi:hypothetical protein
MYARSLHLHTRPPFHAVSLSAFHPVYLLRPEPPSLGEARATRPGDLREYLNGAVLREVRQSLFLPARVRRM